MEAINPPTPRSLLNREKPLSQVSLFARYGVVSVTT